MVKQRDCIIVRTVSSPGRHAMSPIEVVNRPAGLSTSAARPATRYRWFRPRKCFSREPAMLPKSCWARPGPVRQSIRADHRESRTAGPVIRYFVQRLLVVSLTGDTGGTVRSRAAGTGCTESIRRHRLRARVPRVDSVPRVVQEQVLSCAMSLESLQGNRVSTFSGGLTDNGAVSLNHRRLRLVVRSDSRVPRRARRASFASVFGQMPADSVRLA